MISKSRASLQKCVNNKLCYAIGAIAMFYILTGSIIRIWHYLLLNRNFNNSAYKTIDADIVCIDEQWNFEIITFYYVYIFCQYKTTIFVIFFKSDVYSFGRLHSYC